MPEQISEQDNLNALLQTMVEGMIIQDNSGRIIQYNKAALDILGMASTELNESEEEIISEIDLPEDAAEWDKIFPGKSHPGMSSFQSGQIQKNLVCKIFRYDGEVRWISLNAVPVVDNRTGRPYQLISTFTDITEMRKMVNELKQIQLLYNISQDLMAITNLEGYFKKINPRFSEILGYNLQEITSQKFINLIHPDDQEATSIEINKMATNKSVHFINRYREKNGAYRTFDWAVVKDPETNLLYFTARDISDYRSEELDLIQSSKLFSLGELNSGLAYMINGQISIIGGHLSFIKESIQQEKLNLSEIKRKIHSIEESVLRLSKTIKDLNSYMRNPNNEEISEVSLSHIIDPVLELCRERFRIHAVKLEVNIQENLFIRCKETQVAHALMTLLNNAYNSVHSQRDGWVRVTTNKKDGFISITITDSSTNTFRMEFPAVQILS